ncbi:STAS domain-containing protein [Neorhizobium sp. DT-125]|uniref:STAS domain-containing protein n=1 Tax=Neorhizobium sp. DT-125 TaxID=3396163 RepID=UPI003F1A84B8
MPASNVKDDCLKLPQNLTVRSIVTVQQEMLQFIDKNTSATIALADDCQVDISFIQLMEAARVHVGTAGKHIALAEPAGGAVLDALQRGGFLEGMSEEDAKFWLHQGGMQ